MTPIRIDLFSDTMTRPTPAMRRFMCDAEVGDEQKGEDPTVNRLQERVADLLGHEAALFLPSGTMCNEIAIKVHTRPGDEVLLDRTAHPLQFEGGGPAVLSGVILTPLDGEAGVFTASQVEAATRPPSRYAPRTRLVSVEQTSNLGGGTVWPIETARGVCAAAQRRGLATHMDGARLMNAVVASGLPARDYAASFDSVWIDLTKGLGCPVGAVLAGSRALIEEAWPWKQRLGGAMRQAGIIAAAGLYALDHHVERLAEDHANARRLARGLAGLPHVTVDPAVVQTNIVLLRLDETGPAAAEVQERLAPHGVRLCPLGPRLLRAVTHLDVTEAQVDEAIQAMTSILAS